MALEVPQRLERDSIWIPWRFHGTFAGEAVEIPLRVHLDSIEYASMDEKPVKGHPIPQIIWDSNRLQSKLSVGDFSRFISHLISEII